MERKGNFPDDEHDYAAKAKAPGVKPGDENYGGKHHHMVPVKYAAGGAAAVFHKPRPKRAPKEHAHKVKDVKSDGNEKKDLAVYNAEKVKRADGRRQKRPDGAHYKGVLFAFQNVVLKTGDAEIPKRFKTFREKFLRPDGKIFAAGHKLKRHINEPDYPKDMEKGKAPKEIEAVHHVVLLRAKNE